VTVAAVVLAPPREDAHAMVGGVAAIRRIADLAWAGGALPIVVLVDDDAAVLDVGTPLSGASGTVVVPAGNAAADPIARFVVGLAAARREVDGTDAALLWPGTFVHLDAETVTSLIEAHGVDPGTALVPTYDGTPGWPLLLPTAHAAAASTSAGSLADLPGALRAAGVPTRLVELGDPGITHDLATPPDDLPAFAGPPEPVGGAAHDWGERIPAADPSPAPPPGAR
jgi:CTP:molybdopterin cytidylyltransferase MocA